MLSRRSGGPRTPEGRKASSQNALKTGVYATTTILPGEDAEQYEELENQLMRDFSPADTVSRALVRSLAGLIWKRLRLERIEHRTLADTLSAPVSEHENPTVRLHVPYKIAREAVNLAMRVPSAELRTLNETFNFALESMRKDSLTPQTIAALERSHPALWRVFQLEAARYPSLTGPADWAVFEVEGNRLHHIVCQQFIDEYGAVPLLITNEEAIRDSIRGLKEKRLLAVMKIPVIQRAYDDLDRAFCRTLAELRKHQRWLTEFTVFDITPVQPARGDADAMSAGDTKRTGSQLEDT